MDGENAFSGESAPIQATNSADLRDQLKRLEIHPVLIFGTASSGKSAFLQSLIYYGAQGEGAERPQVGFRVEGGPDAFPPDYPEALLLHSLARNFYKENIIDGRRDGHYPRQTSALSQFFVTTDLHPADKDLPLQRFGFLEGNGEAFHRKPKEAGGKAGEFVDLTPLVLDLIQFHQAPLSLVLVAPYFVQGEGRGGGNIVGREESCKCLNNAVQQYFNLRPLDLQYMDNISLLVTKWDIHCRVKSGNNNETTYSYPGIADTLYPEVLAHVKEWPLIWNCFSNRPNYGGGRVLMPYSSGVDINGTIVLDHPAQPDFDVFNRTVWNWLYGNAAAEYSRSAPPRRKVLCPDTQRPVCSTPTILERYARYLLRTQLLERRA